jgi:hypothetical protein
MDVSVDLGWLTGPTVEDVNLRSPEPTLVRIPSQNPTSSGLFITKNLDAIRAWLWLWLWQTGAVAL